MANIFPHGFGSRLLVAAHLALALGCGGSEPVTPPPPSELALRETAERPAGNAVRIVFLGDSLSAGHGLSEAEAFPALVQQRLREKGYPVDVVNAGVSGDTTAGGLSRIDWVLRSEPQLLVVELGGNDALRGQPLDNVEANLREIVRRGRAAGARVLVLGMDIPTNFGPEYATGFNELYRRVAEEEDAELLPGFIREVGLDSSLMMPDGIHPNAEGHRKLAEALAATIEGKLP